MKKEGLRQTFVCCYVTRESNLDNNAERGTWELKQGSKKNQYKDASKTQTHVHICKDIYDAPLCSLQHYLLWLRHRNNQSVLTEMTG